MSLNTGWIAEVLADLEDVAGRDGCLALRDALSMARRIALAEAVLRSESPVPGQRPPLRVVAGGPRQK